MDYTVVIATRNRPAVLLESIPRMLSQSRPPAQLVVVDSSDNHGATVSAVNESVQGFEVELSVRPHPRGLTLQRNAALELVHHPLVFFPDDDSIWFPGTAEHQLRVYEQDTEGRVAGVCGAESPSPPPGFSSGGSAGYRKKWSERLRARIAWRRMKLEGFFFPDPVKVIVREQGERFSVPADVAAEGVVPVEYMTGFRMSFRTEVIRKFGFDENLKNYALYEDIDASLNAWKHGAVVGVNHARVFHHRSPERRDNGEILGLTSVLNKAYLVVKHSPKGHIARKQMFSYARFICRKYALAARDSFGRQRAAGAKWATECIRELLDREPVDAGAVYQELMDRYHERSPSA